MADLHKAEAAAREALAHTAEDTDPVACVILARAALRDLLAALDAVRLTVVPAELLQWTNEPTKDRGSEAFDLDAGYELARKHVREMLAVTRGTQTSAAPCVDERKRIVSAIQSMSDRLISYLATQAPSVEQVAPAEGRMADALHWIIRHADAPERAARGPHRGMAAIKHVAKSALAHQPMDDRSSEANIEPARENSYAARAQRDLLIAAKDALEVLQGLPDDAVMPDHPIFGQLRRAIAAPPQWVAIYEDHAKRPNEYDYGRPDLRGYGEGTEP